LAAQDPRVFLISLDGMGYEALTTDPAASGMRFLRKIQREGIAMPMQAAFPSLTAAGHASLFTGSYGDENGVTANQVAPRPRPAHRFDERVNGFRAEQLDKENFWLDLGRRGVRTVAHNSTQGFPCNANNSGPGVTVLNGYQTEELAGERLLRGKDVEWLNAAPEEFPAPKKSRKAVLYFRYQAKNHWILGAVFARGRRYDSVRMAVAGENFVDIAAHRHEDEPFVAAAKPRPLARFYSDALALSASSGAYFRLFELAESGRDFMMHQTAAKEISLCHGGASQDASAKRKLWTKAGAFVGNGATGLYERGELGPVLSDGQAERRLLESLELHARQTMRFTRALEQAYEPRLLVDYLSTPDDMLHMWWGWAAKGERFLDSYRAWGYQIIDWRVSELARLGSPNDHLIVVSDHGMTAMTHELRVNALLKRWGYRDRVVASYYGLFTNTRDWKDGFVDAAAERRLLEELRARLETFEFQGKKIFREFYWPEDIAAKYGVGGDRGARLYFDLVPGWSGAYTDAEPAALELPHPRGEHGPLPTRTDLMAIYLHYGPKLNSRPATLRTKDIAGIVKKILEP
jgi:hypothetical protein